MKDTRKGFKLAVVLKKTQFQIDEGRRDIVELKQEIERLNQIKARHTEQLTLSEEQRRMMLKGVIDTQLYMATSEYIDRKRQIINKTAQQISKHQHQLGELNEAMLKLLKVDKGLTETERDFYKQQKLQRFEKSEKKMDELFLTSRYLS